MAGYQKFLHVGLALDPIHVGTGGARLGRVDLTIVRDPVTRVPKIPGSSLAGVYRTYVAMALEEQRSQQPESSGERTAQALLPSIARALGQPRGDYLGHCAQPDCPVCTVFGFARGRDQSGGFAGLAAFTDAHVLLFPVPTRQGPRWITCPDALRLIGLGGPGRGPRCRAFKFASKQPLNLGWLLLPVMTCGQFQNIVQSLQNLGVPDYICERLALVPDRPFPSHCEQQPGGAHFGGYQPGHRSGGGAGPLLLRGLAAGNGAGVGDHRKESPALSDPRSANLRCIQPRRCACESSTRSPLPGAPGGRRHGHAGNGAVESAPSESIAVYSDCKL
jgi:hypothetical protein